MGSASTAPLRPSPPKAAGGTILGCRQELVDYPIIRAVCIQSILKQLRANARIHKVDLPDRLTPLDPECPKWWQEIEANRKAANSRSKDRAKAKGSKTRGKERSHEIARGS
jgi:hypothetical protein